MLVCRCPPWCFTDAMKTLVIPSMMAALAQIVCAVEYVTLSKSNPEANIAPGALVEIVACTAWRQEAASWSLKLEMTLASGDIVDVSAHMQMPSGGLFLVSPLINQKFMNLAKARIYRTDSKAIEDALTLKITPADEIGSAGPKTVLVMPEGSTGDFDVVIEASGDMVTWTPLHSQGVTGNGPHTFFRTRIVKR
jgi:hypothetical protein